MARWATVTRACVDWFDWDIWVTTDDGPRGDFGSMLLRRPTAHVNARPGGDDE